ncbi:MAG: bifunctional diaminohydroxyphosphoribosylaminopyrimidine deaminase/5-amino-6-(5-phosphoribosylamino)uracil reductase RibD [Verrucomicrobia bacterium]|nr:bifunctional diaminohydroxyphosphoribosylaminopyrimidine deaminase/5-amino-6-(5-phosphoribosylamino)uracil reductase RibD [Verrucomicrobiota bacterium]MDA1067572.1 bifunctional diaminohydroxyphosphoribosylaminopyrimidine deaminase/5-amino-6-(5-phosphoribosylamino)uracil reductase RibD [Verrucomicrobiota bacterium]
MTDSHFMEAALVEARKGWGNVGANPMVGAVIVEGEEIVSRGHHEFFGGPHAEVNALKNLERKPAEDAVMYVTLEPCSSTGKTGPCTSVILESGIQKIVIGAIDPDQRHRGRGVALIREAGLDVTTGILKEACEDLNLIFNHTATHEGPFLAGKTATTLDGKVATRTGNSKWITGENARTDVMLWRRYFPAIAVGAGTVLADNPSLTIRIGDVVSCSKRLIFDRRLTTLSGLRDLKVYNDEFKEKTIVVTHDDVEGSKELLAHGVSIWTLPKEANEFWKAFNTRCIQEKISGVYFEGGPGLLSDLLLNRQLHYLFAYRAPKFLGDAKAPSFVEGQEIAIMEAAYSLSQVQHALFGDDQLMRGFLKYPEE